MSGTSERATFEELIGVMDKLRDPGGCPWDREQDWGTLRQYVLEEAHEVVEAIDSGDPERVADECGDLLFQVVFLSRIAREHGWFDVYDTITHIRDKLVRRHPHVFGDVIAETSEDVLRNWDKLKAQEKAKKDARRTLDGVPAALPALLRAHKIGEKSARVGFDWADVSGVLEKVDEELAELREAIASGDTAAIGHEYGDILFVLAQLGRFVKHNPEDAAREASARFERRFYAMEADIHEDGHEIRDLSPEEQERRWQKAKTRVK